MDQSGDECIENLINGTVQNYQPLDKKPVENSQNSQIPAIAINAGISYLMNLSKKY